MSPRMYKKGFTLVELLVVMAIMSMIIAISTMSLSSIQNKTSLGTSVDTLVSDIQQQQLKAMIGDAENRSNGDSYGIHFDSNPNNSKKYTLFHGTTYIDSDSSNFVVNFDPSLAISAVTFPNGNLIFNQISGEMNGYSATTNTVTILNTNTNEAKTITVNRYGVITQIN